MARTSMIVFAVFVSGFAHGASADFARVSEQSEFVALVQGKTLSRPFVKLEVSSDGLISGKGATWDISGSWTWVDGFFCRDLNWGGEELGSNCQEVQADDNRIQFTFDKGAGDTAEFRLK